MTFARPVRRAVFAAATLTALLAAAACGGGDAGSGSSSAPAADLTATGDTEYWGGKDTSGNLKNLIDAFNKTSTTGKVTFHELPDNADQQRQQMIQNTQIKNPAMGILSMDVVWTAEFAANGYVEALPADQFPTEQFLPAGNDIPWRITEDWARFKAITTGHTLVMGRGTYDSIGRPLPGRRTVVVTRNPDWSADGVETAPDVETALTRAAESGRTVFVAGGGEIYRAAWDALDRLEVTEVDIAPDGDVTFPEIDPAVWVEEHRDTRDGFAFVSYRRRTAL